MRGGSGGHAAVAANRQLRVGWSSTQLSAAIQTQRSLLQDTARSQHRLLRSLHLAWRLAAVGGAAEGGAADAPTPSLGWSRCPRCGVRNDAGGRACVWCGAARPNDAPTGSLSLVVAARVRAGGAAAAEPNLPGACGFRATHTFGGGNP